MRLIVFGMLLNAIAFCAFPDAPSAAGDWDGAVGAGGVQLRLVLHLKSTGDKTYTATLDSIDQGANGIPVDKVVLEGDTLKLTVSAVHGSYEGTFNADRTILSGKWTQQATLPLNFKKRPLELKPATPSIIDGAWQGLLTAGEQKLRITVHVHTGADGALRILFSSVDQGGAPIAAKNEKFDGSVLSFDIPIVRGHYEGKLSVDKNTIRGTWTQGASYPLDLKRGDKPIAVARPQEPKPPFPYTQEEVSYSNPTASQITLAGTFTKPIGPGPFPAVLLIPGSGPHDRDETIFGHKPFLVITDYLARRGIAVLRYDDRGVGKSVGNFSIVTSLDLASDAMAGVRYLLTRTDVDKNHIGLIGHSEGGILAPIAASRMPEVRFIVLLAGTAVRGDQVIVEQQVRIAKASGASEADQSDIRKSMTKAVELLREGKSEPDFGAAMEEVVSNQAQAAGIFAHFNTPWFRYFISYDPALALEKVKCPVLALSGDRDLQVIPDENLPVMKAALEKANNHDVTIVRLPGLNHLFQTCKTGLPAEYASIPETMSPAALEAISDWIHKHVS